MKHSGENPGGLVELLWWGLYRLGRGGFRGSRSFISSIGVWVERDSRGNNREKRGKIIKGKTVTFKWDRWCQIWSSFQCN